MLTIITGAPGTGKSAAVVSLLSELSKDRAVYSSGIPDFSVPHEELDDPTKWHDVVPDGSIIVVDEAQRIWRPRGPGSKVPLDIAAMETHRHRGIDFYIITQAPRLVDSNIRGLVGRHVHLRDLGILGRWWYEWPECADSCAASWKQAPIKKRYRMNKAALGLYTSASIHIKPIRSMPWMLVVMLVAVVLTIGLAWRSWGIIQDKAHPKALAVPSGVVANVSSGVPGAMVSGVPVAVNPYDYTATTPRLASHPESAPAYDALRVVAVMPVIAGGVCMRDNCRCYTQQGTLVVMPVNDCKRLISEREFNPYVLTSGSGGGSAARPSGRVGAQPVPASPVPVAASPSAASIALAM